MSLLALQRDMRAFLSAEDETAATRLGASASPGLSVYLNNYRAQLITLLEGSFPRTHAWIGDEAFLSAAAQHIDRVPPSSWTLDAYARDFPETLGWLYPNDAEIAEIARIELALEESFVSADHPALTVEQLHDVTWDSATLRVAPTIDFVQLTTNAFAIWSALVADETPPAAEPLTGTALVWRQDYWARIRLMEAFEYQALLKVRGGMSFGDLCDGVVNVHGEVEGAVLVGGWLGRWIGDGLIVAIEGVPG
jgi:hypothetical protein